MVAWSDLWLAYKLRWRRRRYLARAIRKRSELTPVQVAVPADRSAHLVFSTMRNEVTRLPFWLEHHRKLGVDHFLIVDNGSDDGTLAYLKEQDDVSVWTTTASYKASRFGVDWLAWLQLKYAHGRWALTVDADELFVYPQSETRSLKELTSFLDACGVDAMAALMLTCTPKRPCLRSPMMRAAITQVLPWFYPDTWEQQKKFGAISIRDRESGVSFSPITPHLASSGSGAFKCHVSSTHIALPRRLNVAFDRRLNRLTGRCCCKIPSEVIEIGQRKVPRHLRIQSGIGYYDEIVRDPFCERESDTGPLNWWIWG